MAWDRAACRAPGRWLLDATIEGRVYRLAEESVEVSDAAGRAYRYQEGLGPIQASPGALGRPDATIAVTIEAPLAWADMVARGATLEHVPVVLRRIHDGMSLDEARVWLSGWTSEVAYDTDQDEVSATLVRRILGRTPPVLDEDAAVDDVTWAGTDRDSAVNGAYYPLVIGFPGQMPAGELGRPAYPGLGVHVTLGPNARILIADRRIGAVGTNAVRVWDTTDGADMVSGLADTVVESDDIGREVTLINMAVPPVGITFAKGRQYWIAYTRTAGFGGTLSPRTGAVVRGAGSVILYLLETYSSVQVDVSRCLNAAQVLDSVLIDAAINDGNVDAVEWIEAHLVPILPIEPVWGPDGLYYRVWRWDATANDAIAHLSCDTGGAERLGPVKPAEIEIYNRFSLAYRQDRARGRYLGRLFLRGDPDDSDPRKLASLACKRSESTYGVLRAPPIQSEVLWDQASAGQCLHWRAALHCWPKRVVAIALPPEWAYLEIGDVVLFSDSTIAVSAQPAVISSILIGDPTRILAEVTLLDHPVHTVHTP